MDLPGKLKPLSTAGCLGAVLISLLSGCSSTTTHPVDNLLPLDRLRPQTPPVSVESRNSPQDASAERETSAEGDDTLFGVLTHPHWIRSVQPPGGEEPDYRWIYPDFDKLLFGDVNARPDLRLSINDRDPVVAANAAIGLARTGDVSVGNELASAAGNAELDANLRSAAAETLGRISAGSVLLQRLIDEEVKRAGRSVGAYSPTVHAELIRALGRRVSPAGEPRLTAALMAGADEVKLAALEVWQEAPGGEFPKQALVLRNHRDSQIRAHLLATLARHPSKDTFDHLTFALSDPDLTVRSAAIRAMGLLGDERAGTTLENLLDRGAEAERIAAVRSLAKLGKADLVAGGANDKAWRVRLAVAEVLAELPGDPDVALAKRLLDDPSGEVQHRAIAAIGTWPPDVAEPLLLDALEKCPYRSQKLAAELLAGTWTEGRALLAAFPFGQKQSVRDPALAEIRRAYGDRGAALAARRNIPNEPPPAYSPEQLNSVAALLQTLRSERADSPEYALAIANLRRRGPSLVDMLEYLVDRRSIVLPESVFAEVLVSECPDFAIVEQLKRDDVQVRRTAARRLADECSRRRPRPLLLRRLADLAIAETDAVVWQYILEALADQDDDQVFRLVYAAVGHESSGIREMACRLLGRHPHPQHAAVLVPALNDASESVTCAAVESLGVCGADVDPALIVRLLGARSESVRLSAAMTLTRLGSPKGPAALERLAYSSNDQTRLRAAQMMGELALPEFAPTLIRLLDDRHGIRLAALNSLPQVVDCEEAEAAGLRESDRVEAWRKWMRNPKRIQDTKNE